MQFSFTKDSQKKLKKFQKQLNEDLNFLSLKKYIINKLLKNIIKYLACKTEDEISNVNIKSIHNIIKNRLGNFSIDTFQKILLENFSEILDFESDAIKFQNYILQQLTNIEFETKSFILMVLGKYGLSHFTTSDIEEKVNDKILGYILNYRAHKHFKSGSDRITSAQLVVLFDYNQFIQS
jgi:hypothetical protein